MQDWLRRRHIFAHVLIRCPKVKSMMQSMKSSDRMLSRSLEEVKVGLKKQIVERLVEREETREAVGEDKRKIRVQMRLRQLRIKNRNIERRRSRIQTSHKGACPTRVG